MPVLKPLLRPAIRAAREAPVYASLLAGWGVGPLAVFLPAYGREGAALLRVYNMARALRAFGWRTLVLPWNLTLAQRLRVLNATRPTVLVMQGSRHALNRPALYPGHPVVYDMDDADFHLPHLADHVLRAMEDVTGVIAGSRYIAEWCRGRGAEARVVWTGTPVSTRFRPPQAGRCPVIAWAQTRPMSYTGEADFVRTVARTLAARRPGLTLRLHDRRPGDDPGFAESFRCAGLTVEWQAAMSYDRYLASFDDVALGLAPLAPEAPFSRGKSFGKVLAYLDRTVPVLASDAGEHGRFFTPETGIVSNDPETWVVEAARLLDDAAARQKMAGAAFRDYREYLSSTAVAARTDRVLRQLAPRRDAEAAKHTI